MAGHFLLGKAARNFTLADVEKLTDLPDLDLWAVRIDYQEVSE